MKEYTLNCYTKDGTKWVECEELGIYEYGNTFKKAMKRFGETLGVIILNYCNTPDTKLTKEAIELKKMLLEMDVDEEVLNFKMTDEIRKEIMEGPWNARVDYCCHGCTHHCIFTHEDIECDKPERNPTEIKADVSEMKKKGCLLKSCEGRGCSFCPYNRINGD